MIKEEHDMSDCEIQGDEYERRFVAYLKEKDVDDPEGEYESWMKASEPTALEGMGDPEQDAEECFDYYSGGQDDKGPERLFVSKTDLVAKASLRWDTVDHNTM
jgi:hypothetical protein